MISIFKYIALIHLGISLAFLIFTIRPRGLQEAMFRFMIVFFLPVAGLIYLIVTSLVNKTIKSSDKNVKEYIDYIEDLTHIHYVKDIDFEQEINIIPAQDSLNFNEDKTRRSYIIYILKRGFIKHVESLKKALGNEDSETAHYAAAALMEIKNQFDELLASLSRKYSADSDAIETLEEYVGVLKKYINSGLLEKTSYDGYLRLYSKLLGELLSLYKGKRSYFADKIDADIGLKNFKEAREYCSQFEKSFPNEADPLLASMKLNYAIADHENLFSDIQKLRRSNLPLGPREKDIVSFWEGRGLNVP